MKIYNQLDFLFEYTFNGKTYQAIAECNFNKKDGLVYLITLSDNRCIRMIENEHSKWIETTNTLIEGELQVISRQIEQHCH